LTQDKAGLREDASLCHIPSPLGQISAARLENNKEQHLGTARRHDEGERTVNPYVVFLMYLMAILGFVALTLLLNRVLGPKPVASAVKLEPFECGATPVTTLNVKAVPIKYYAVAIIFILFDLETVFLFIWALGAQPLTSFMLFTFFLFMVLLVLILLYVYKARLIEAVTE
jgi:NADH-quinone oxidoreductase subunit A